MMYEMYAIKDELSGFTTPIPFIDCENAKRYFRTQLEDNIYMKYNKKDYSLWYTGLFDEKDGIFKSVGPELIERGYTNGNEDSIPDNTDTM